MSGLEPSAAAIPTCHRELKSLLSASDRDQPPRPWFVVFPQDAGGDGELDHILAVIVRADKCKSLKLKEKVAKG